MSGPIRQQLGPTKRRLKNYVAAINVDDFFNTLDFNDLTKENIQKLQQLKHDLAYNMENITRTVKQLQGLNTQWVKLIQSSGEDILSHEEALYATEVNDDTNGVLEIISQGLKLMVTKCFKAVRSVFIKPSNDPYNSGSQSRKRKRWNTVLYSPKNASELVIIMNLLSIIGQNVTTGCSDATTLTATTKQCILHEKDQYQECSYEETTRLALVPQGQQTCLMYSHEEGAPLASLKLNVKQIRMICQPNNKFYTRSFKMHVSSRRRCPKAGSCTDGKCTSINSDSDVPELDRESFNYPGHTYCASVPACWANDCFHCTTGCLFYRVYAKPASSKIFEVLSCPVWRFQVELTAKMITPRQTTENTFTLEPGVKTKWKTLELTLIGIASPPTPILSKSFIREGDRMIISDTAATGQEVDGQIGSLQCSNAQTAKDFKCSISPNICKCNPQHDSVGCLCRDLSVDHLFNNEQYVLPLNMQGINIGYENGQIYSQFHSFASLEIQVTNKGTTFFHTITSSTCVIKTEDFKGCYKCLTGAQLKYTCNTNKGENLAHVSCGTEGRFSTMCTEKGITETVTLSFSHADINVQCQVFCPGKVTTFNLTGRLVFIDKTSISNISNIVAGKTGENEIELPDFKDFLKWLGNNWYFIFIGVLVIILILISIPIIPTLINSISYGLKQIFVWCKTKFRLQQVLSWCRTKLKKIKQK